MSWNTLYTTYLLPFPIFHFFTYQQTIIYILTKSKMQALETGVWK